MPTAQEIADYRQARVIGQHVMPEQSARTAMDTESRWDNGQESYLSRVQKAFEDARPAAFRDGHGLRGPQPERAPRIEGADGHGDDMQVQDRVNGGSGIGELPSKSAQYDVIRNGVLTRERLLKK